MKSAYAIEDLGSRTGRLHRKGWLRRLIYACFAGTLSSGCAPNHELVEELVRPLEQKAGLTFTATVTGFAYEDKTQNHSGIVEKEFRVEVAMSRGESLATVYHNDELFGTITNKDGKIEQSLLDDRGCPVGMYSHSWLSPSDAKGSHADYLRRRLRNGRHRRERLDGKSFDVITKWSVIERQTNDGLWILFDEFWVDPAIPFVRFHITSQTDITGKNTISPRRVREFTNVTFHDEIPEVLRDKVSVASNRSQ